MSRYDSRSISESPLDFEVTRIDCSKIRKDIYIRIPRKCHNSLFVPHYSLFMPQFIIYATIHYLFLIIHATVHYLFPIIHHLCHNSLFVPHYSSFIHNSLFVPHFSLFIPQFIICSSLFIMYAKFLYLFLIIHYATIHYLFLIIHYLCHNSVLVPHYSLFIPQFIICSSLFIFMPQFIICSSLFIIYATIHYLFLIIHYLCYNSLFVPHYSLLMPRFIICSSLFITYATIHYLILTSPFDASGRLYNLPEAPKGEVRNK